jgi:acetyl-CoA acetyltransferase
MPTDIVLLEGVRTGFGAFGGSLKDLSATDLGVVAAKGALERAKVDPAWIDHTVFGNVVQTSGDAIYLARHIGLKAGVPKEKPALILNRLCGSGQEAIVTGARMILGARCIRLIWVQFCRIYTDCVNKRIIRLSSRVRYDANGSWRRRGCSLRQWKSSWR